MRRVLRVFHKGDYFHCVLSKTVFMGPFPKIGSVYSPPESTLQFRVVTIQFTQGSPVEDALILEPLPGSLAAFEKIAKALIERRKNPSLFERWFGWQFAPKIDGWWLLPYQTIEDPYTRKEWKGWRPQHS